MKTLTCTTPGTFEYSSTDKPEFHERESTLMSSRNATIEDFEHVIRSVKARLVNLPVGWTLRMG